MNILQTLLVSIQSLKGNRLRTMLTVLGVVVGIFSIIVIMTIITIWLLILRWILYMSLHRMRFMPNMYCFALTIKNRFFARKHCP